MKGILTEERITGDGIYKKT